MAGGFALLQVLPYDEKLTETPQTQVTVQFGSKSHVAMESDGKVRLWHHDVGILEEHQC